jgi:hypothetical protein
MQPYEDPSPFLRSVREAIRVRHYSIRTEEAYVQWVKRFILFHGKRHPAQMGEPEVSALLSHLAVDGQVAAATQNQALNALVFCIEPPTVRWGVCGHRPGCGRQPGGAVPAVGCAASAEGVTGQWPPAVRIGVAAGKRSKRVGDRLRQAIVVRDGKARTR